MGRNRKPQAIHDLNGNPSKTRRRKEPQVPDAPGALRCPAWLDDIGKRRWKSLKPLLQEMGVLTAADADLLAAYCHAYSMFRRADAQIGRDPELWPQKAPFWKMRKESFEQMAKIASAFGMTPAARAGLSPAQIASGEHQDAFDELTARREALKARLGGGR